MSKSSKFSLSFLILAVLLMSESVLAKEPTLEEHYKDVPYFKEHSGKAEALKPPKEVRSHLEESIDSCREVGGSPALLTFKALGPVHLEDTRDVWVVPEVEFRCDGALSLYSGSRGGGVYVYLDLKNGHAKEVFSRIAHGATIERIGSLSKIWLTVYGEMCGQTGEFSFADAWFCERPLVWDPEKKTMDFSPLSEIREWNPP